MGIISQHAFIQPLDPRWYGDAAAAVDMIRLDLLHPVISGNKWFKLKHNLRYAIEHKYDDILTFGGGYSNHLIATAAAAKKYGVRSIGIVRGNYNTTELTPTLKACKELDMELFFISREEYAKKEDEAWLKVLYKKYSEPYIIPEGGANDKGRVGAGEIAELIPEHYSHICVSVGTGTTFIGLRNNLLVTKTVLGFAPMKKGSYIAEEIAPLIRNDNNWHIFDRWHFGGFGKWDNTLLAFMNQFYELNAIPLDIIYTAKMMYGVEALLKEGYFSKDSNILCVHTGGLQGNVSVQKQLVY